MEKLKYKMKLIVILQKKIIMKLEFKLYKI